MSAAEHTTSGIADAPDGLSQPLAEAADRLANTLAHAADRLPQALTEAADRLPQAIRQPAKQATAACRLLRLGRLLRLHRLLRYSRLHWLLRNRLLHGLLHRLLYRLLYRLLHGLLHGLLRRLLRRGLLGLLHDLLRLLLGWLSRLRVLSGLLRRLLGCLLRLIHLIWGHALRIGFALGVTLVRHGFLLARSRFSQAAETPRRPVNRPPMTPLRTTRRSCAPCSIPLGAQVLCPQPSGRRALCRLAPFGGAGVRHAAPAEPEWHTSCVYPGKHMDWPGMAR